MGRDAGRNALRPRKVESGPMGSDDAAWVDDMPATIAHPSRPGLPGTEMLVNRLRKNLRHLGKWARREGVKCYRVYDGDLPEYALAVDLYEGWAHVQEYAAPATVDPGRAQARLADAMAAIPEALGTPAERVVLKVRRRQKGLAQYERQAAVGRFREVHEGGLRFLVNLTDYLDTGLFLDHRPTRALIRSLVRGGRFLNLFAYTGTASVYAAAGGAASTTTVDMSSVYLDWARRNMMLNGFAEGRAHRFVRADCLAWLATPRPERFHLIFMDPPTFSNSKRMGEHTFEVQRDHADLIQAAARLLARNGVLLFSNNFRHFKMNRHRLAGLTVEDITHATIPPDFQRNPRIHTCWRIAGAG
jgi:23S rRNA (guanine2445-N2)-methyltransferase / 23S rRNA (guanine2069-N7)-methyltransferase